MKTQTAAFIYQLNKKMVLFLPKVLSNGASG